ncbi:serine/threonine-protein kinase [Salinactinospora qingdaonensis]|uniref:Protein kinase domain-containing protein n=1 Tax=Salinactinospora qingdaonensis TaxID=702744 RepID=A0ABP7G3T6_9ACTN
MPDPESLSPSDPTSFGGYSVVGRLGRGGQGIVYLARNDDGDEFAVKVLNEQWSQDEALRRRFEKEVRAAQKVASFCTAAIHEANLESEPPYVVSEYVPGPSLQDAVVREGPRRGASLQRLAVSTATALVAIHQAGIVHRDFKPGNVLLGPDGPRVIDFGVARVVDGTATMTNSIVGTPSYMAPEQIEGRDLTDRADIFAWGCVMAFASTGNTPFGADSVPAVVHRVVSAPPSLDGIAEQLRPIVEECLNKDPAQRPTAQQLLMRLLGHEHVEAASPDEVVAAGERVVEHGSPSGPQYPHSAPPPPHQGGPQTPQPQSGPQAPQQGGPQTPQPQQPYRPTPSGPQTPFPGSQSPSPGAPPRSPQTGAYPPSPHAQQPPPTGGHPGMGGAQPPMGTPTNTSYSQAPPNRHPHANVPPKQYPQQQQPVEDPVLSQGWIVPAVLIGIIILLLLLVLASFT